MNLTDTCCGLLETTPHMGVGSAAEWCQQLTMLDRGSNLTVLIVSHGPIANVIPAIRGLWWSSFLCTPALPFYILYQFGTHFVSSSWCAFPAPLKKSKLQYKGHNMINGEEKKWIRGVRAFLLFEDSLITENITLWNASEDCHPLHFPNVDRGLVHMTGNGTGRGSPSVWTIYSWLPIQSFSVGITGCFIMNIAIWLRNDEALKQRRELTHFTCKESFSSVNHFILYLMTGWGWIWWQCVIVCKWYSQK